MAVCNFCDIWTEYLEINCWIIIKWLHKKSIQAKKKDATKSILALKYLIMLSYFQVYTAYMQYKRECGINKLSQEKHMRSKRLQKNSLFAHLISQLPWRRWDMSSAVAFFLSSGYIWKTVPAWVQSGSSPEVSIHPAALQCVQGIVGLDDSAGYILCCCDRAVQCVFHSVQRSGDCRQEHHS